MEEEESGRREGKRGERCTKYHSNSACDKNCSISFYSILIVISPIISLFPARKKGRNRQVGIVSGPTCHPDSPVLFLQLQIPSGTFVEATKHFLVLYLQRLHVTLIRLISWCGLYVCVCV